MTIHSPEYREVLQSDRWRGVRAEAMRRASGKCQKCGKTARQARCPLDAHHAAGYGQREDGSEILGNEDPSELLILCRYPCHRRAHGRPGYGALAWRWWRYRLRGVLLAGLIVVVAIETLNVAAMLTK